MKFSPGNAQHIGARSEQQDSFGFSDPDDRSFVAHAGVAAVVADGMGGLANGGAASSTAVHAFLKAYESKDPAEPIPDALLRSINSANHAVMTLWRKSGAKDNLGTTLAAVVLHEDWLYWVSAGDSRVYFYQGGRLTRLTTDHVYAADLDEQVGKGRITREQAITHPEREALTSYLGLETLPRVDRSVRAFPVKPGDNVVICSDGLYRALSDEEIAGSLEKDARRTCETLVERAVAKHIARQDNITVIALKCQEEETTWERLAKPLATAAVLVVLIVGGFLFWWRSVPRISLFTADQARIQAGESAVLRWSVNRGTVLITGIGRMDQKTGARSVSPSRKTTYTLVAQNLFGSDQRSIDVDVVPPRKTATLAAPNIAVFRADPPTVKAGGSVRLSWKVEGKVSEVRLGGQKVKPQDSRTIPNVRGATTFTLTATGPQGQDSARDLQVAVSVSPPRIILFTATPKSIQAGKSAVLKWSVKDAAVIRIDPALGGAELQPAGTEKVSPAATTAYTLTAAGTGKPATAKATVTVVAAPKTPVKIAGFASDKPEIREGGVATLKWAVTGDVRSVTIDNGIGQVKSADSRKVTPSSKTTYTLTAVGAGGVTGTAQVTVDILQPPKIEVFEAAPDGQGWRLRWQVTGADRAGTRVSIEPGVGRVEASCPPDGRVIQSATPDQLTLTVEGPGGTDSKHVTLLSKSGPSQ